MHEVCSQHRIPCAWEQRIVKQHEDSDVILKTKDKKFWEKEHGQEKERL